MTKNKLKLITIAADILILLIAIITLKSCADSTDTYQTDFIAMDTYVSFTVNGKNPSIAAQSAQRETKRLESLLSVTDPDSEVSKINSANGQTLTISGETAAVIELALNVGHISGGALDITLRPVIKEWGFTSGDYKVPSAETLEKLLEKVDYKSVDLKLGLISGEITLPEGFEIDLGAAAKGYVGDRVIETLKENRITSALVNFGGNIQALGRRENGEKWRVGIKSPFDESNFGVLEIEDKAVVTSGGYERFFEDENGVRYHHIINPSNGYPADSGIASATIIDESGAVCDALSTAVFVMGEERAVGVYRNYGDFDMILVTDKGEILITEGIEDCFENTSDMPVKIIKKS